MLKRLLDLYREYRHGEIRSAPYSQHGRVFTKVKGAPKITIRVYHAITGKWQELK